MTLRYFEVTFISKSNEGSLLVACTVSMYPFWTVARHVNGISLMRCCVPTWLKALACASPVVVKALLAALRESFSTVEQISAHLANSFDCNSCSFRSHASAFSL